MANRRRSRPTSDRVASGVEDLIARLRDEGVNNGRAQAEQIVKDAQARADLLVKEAQQEAERIVNQAQEEAENLKRAVSEDLQLTFRDTNLALKRPLNQQFTGKLQRLVGAETEKPELLQKLLLEVASRVKEEVAQAQQVEVLLPRKVAGVGELSRNSAELEQEILTYFVKLISQDLLREGVSFGVAKDKQRGLRLRLIDREVVLDLSERAIAETLLEHLQPRFRALLEGIVK